MEKKSASPRFDAEDIATVNPPNKKMFGLYIFFANAPTNMKTLFRIFSKHSKRPVFKMI